MKKSILILIVALSISACKKGEKCLVSGTWNVDKIILNSTGELLSVDKVEVKFNINGKLYYGINEIDYASSDNSIIINGESYKYNCNGKTLKIYCKFIPIYSFGGRMKDTYTTYLSK